MNRNIFIIVLSIFSVSWLFFAFELKKFENKYNSHKELNELNQSKGLWTLYETATYLSIGSKQLEDIVMRDNSDRDNAQGSFDTYLYLPNIVIEGEYYFTKKEVDNWIEYQMNNGTRIKLQ